MASLNGASGYELCTDPHQAFLRGNEAGPHSVGLLLGSVGCGLAHSRLQFRGLGANCSVQKLWPFPRTPVSPQMAPFARAQTWSQFLGRAQDLLFQQEAEPRFLH